MSGFLLQQLVSIWVVAAASSHCRRASSHSAPMLRNQGKRSSLFTAQLFATLVILFLQSAALSRSTPDARPPREAFPALATLCCDLRTPYSNGVGEIKFSICTSRWPLSFQPVTREKLSQFPHQSLPLPPLLSPHPAKTEPPGSGRGIVTDSRRSGLFSATAFHSTARIY